MIVTCSFNESTTFTVQLETNGSLEPAFSEVRQQFEIDDGGVLIACLTKKGSKELFDEIVTRVPDFLIKELYIYLINKQMYQEMLRKVNIQLLDYPTSQLLIEQVVVMGTDAQKEEFLMPIYATMDKLDFFYRKLRFKNQGDSGSPMRYSVRKAFDFKQVEIRKTIETVCEAGQVTEFRAEPSIQAFINVIFEDETKEKTAQRKSARINVSDMKEMSPQKLYKQLLKHAALKLKPYEPLTYKYSYKFQKEDSFSFDRIKNKDKVILLVSRHKRPVVLIDVYQDDTKLQSDLLVSAVDVEVRNPKEVFNAVRSGSVSINRLGKFKTMWVVLEDGRVIGTQDYCPKQLRRISLYLSNSRSAPASCKPFLASLQSASASPILQLNSSLHSQEEFSNIGHEINSHSNNHMQVQMIDGSKVDSEWQEFKTEMRRLLGEENSSNRLETDKKMKELVTKLICKKFMS